MSSASIANQKQIKSRKTWFDGVAKKAVHTLLRRLTIGHLVVEDGDQRHEFGQSPDLTPYHAHIVIHDQGAYRDVFNNASIGAGEAYMRGWWSTPDLVAVIRLMVANLNVINEADSARPIWSRMATYLFHKFNAGRFMRFYTPNGAAKSPSTAPVSALILQLQKTRSGRRTGPVHAAKFFCVT